jgi:hypothetical protein
MDNINFVITFKMINFIFSRYLDVDQESLKAFNQNLDWLQNGTHGYHLPRHGDLYTKSDFNKSNKNSLPIKIASYILDMS